MTLLFYDGVTEPSSNVRPEWSAVWRSSQTGRDGSTNGAGSYSAITASQPTLTLPSAAATLIMGGAFWLNGSGALSVTDNAPLGFQRVAGTTDLAMFINASGFIEIRRTNAAGTLLATSTGHTAIAASAWYHLQVKVLLHSSAGTVEVRLNGTSVLTVSGVATAGTSGSVAAIKFGNTTTSGSSNDRIYWDDLWFCDTVDATATQGSPNNDFLGDLSVKVHIPSANGDTTQWTPSTGTNHAALIDESPPNTTDYVSDSVSGHLDLVTLPDLPATAQTVYGVQVCIYTAADDAGSIGIKPSLKENSTVTDQSTITLTGTVYAMKYGAFLTKRPSDGAQWTVSDVNGLQAGVKVA